MSVHGEYVRALASVLERLDEVERRIRDDLRPAFEVARVTPDRDLSTAARAALAALAALERHRSNRLEEDGRRPGGLRPLDGRARAGPDAETDEAELRLQAACDHLRAHVRAILGTPLADD